MGNPARGAAVADAKGCVACHVAGKRAGDFHRARGLESPAILAALWNHSFIGDATVRSAPWAAMTDAEMLDLIAFLQSPRS